MRNIAFFTSILITIAVFSGACIVAVVDYSGSEEFHRTVPFPSGGTMSLFNFDGDIEISGWDSDEVEVYAEKWTPRLKRRRIYLFRREGLAPKIAFRHFDDFLEIRTRAAQRKEEETAVDYSINVPHSVNLKNIMARDGNVSISDLYGNVFLQLRRGEIEVENYSGSLTASVIEGSITASFYDLREEDDISLTTREGDVIVYLQPGGNANVMASFPNGDFFSEFGLSEPKEDNKASVQIGEGEGASLRLTALNGNIHLREIR